MPIESSKNPCINCPWYNQLWIGGTQPYVGDTPCLWCEHGNRITCNDFVSGTTTTVRDTGEIKITAKI